MNTNKESIAKVFIEKLFAHTNGIKAITHAICVNMMTEPERNEQKLRKQIIYDQFRVFFMDLLIRPWNLCVSCSPNDPLRDTKNCILYIFGEDYGQGLLCSDILSPDCAYLLYTLMKQKDAFEKTDGYKKIFKNFFANAIIEEKVNRSALVEYVMTYLLHMALQVHEDLYSHTKKLIHFVLSDIRSGTCKENTDRINMINDLLSHLVNDINVNRLDLVFASMNNYTLDAVRHSRKMRNKIYAAVKDSFAQADG